MSAKKKLVVAVATCGPYHLGLGPFKRIFDIGIPASQAKMADVDALLLWGGTDIHPSFYGEGHHKYGAAPLHPSNRDWEEWQMMHEAVKHDKPIIGICRGAQFLCAFAGGSLYQHVGGHNYGHHDIVTDTGEILQTCSAHHQMMCLPKTNHKLLAWSSVRRHGGSYEGQSETGVIIHDAPAQEPEAVYFPELKGFGIQGHPEWQEDTCKFNNWVIAKTRELFNFNQ